MKEILAAIIEMRKHAIQIQELQNETVRNAILANRRLTK